MMSDTNNRQAGPATGMSLLLPITLSTMAIVLLAPILPQLQKAFSTVPGAALLVPMILTIPALCVAILSPVAGMLGDRFGRRRLLLISLILYGFIGMAPLFLSNIYAILISRIGVGITEALIMTLSTTMIGDYFNGKRRDKWLAGQTAVASISALIFFNVGGLLGQFGWRSPFWVYSSAFIMFFLVLKFTWPNTHTQSKKTQNDNAEILSPNVGWAHFPWKHISGILFVTIFSSILFYTVQIQAAPGLVELGEESPARIGFLTSIASLGVPIGTFIYSRISRISVHFLLMIEFSLLAMGFFLMSEATSIQMFLTGCGLNQLGAGMLLPTLLVWAISKLKFEVRARGTGLWTAAFSLGQWLSPIVITTISLKTGQLLPAFFWLACFAGFAALCAVFIGYYITRKTSACASS